MNSAPSTIGIERDAGIGAEPQQGHDGDQEDQGQAGQQHRQRQSRWASCGGRRPRPWRSCGRGRSSPAAEVMRTLIQSETTVVPPVTAERSPPLSRITGAISPVMAASLTEATPSMISPSEGIDVAGLDQHDLRRPPARGPGSGRSCRRAGSTISLALVVTRVARRLSAAALPRPSATLSAKLANSTVGPEPDGQLDARSRPARRARDRHGGRDRGQHRDDPGGEDHRIPGQLAGVELGEGVAASRGRAIAGSRPLARVEALAAVLAERGVGEGHVVGS